MTTTANQNSILQVRDLKVHFPIKSGLLRKTTNYVKAVDGISFDLNEGETLALVGESGCGKTTAGRALMRAIPPTDGEVQFTMRNGSRIDAIEATAEQQLDLRQEMQLIFQDPFASLNPRMTVFDIVADPLKSNNVNKSEVESIVRSILGKVGLSEGYMSRYPHAFSGGQRQRIGIARALVLNPRIVIADEPVSALDVSVQAQILNLMLDLQHELDLTYLFISHDLSVVQYMSHRVAVMYVGKIVEIGDNEELFSQPKHPYTQALLASVPVANPDIKSMGTRLAGEVADPANPPSGCYFHPRCPFAEEICRSTEPELKEIKPGQFASCHFSEKLNLSGVQS